MTRRSILSLAALAIVAALLTGWLPATGAQPADETRAADGPTIAGAVTEADGSPVPGVTVDVFEAMADGSRATWLGAAGSGPDGTYRFPVPSADCHVIVAIAPSGRTFTNGAVWDQQTLCFGDGDEVGHTSVLAPAGTGATIAGTAADTDGAPVVLTVDLFSANGDGTRSAFLDDTLTGADGTYAFDVIAGCYVIVFIAPPDRTFTNGTRWSQQAACVEDGATATVDAVVAADGGDDPGDPGDPGDPDTRYGSDGTGSPTLDDCTIDTASSDLSAVVNGAPAGSVICIDAGDYGDQLLSVNADDRTIRARGQVELGGVVVDADRVTIDGVRVTDRSRVGRLDEAIGVEGDGNAVVNAYIDGAPADDGIVCSWRLDCSNTRFAFNTITGIDSIGIVIHGSNNTVERNNIYGLIRTRAGHDVDAIRFFGQGHRIVENYLHDINEHQSLVVGGDTPHVDCFQTFTTYESYNPNTNPILTADVLIENNYCVRVSRQCLIMENNRTDTTTLRDITFRNNVCETYDGQSINLKGVTDVTIENNYLGGEVGFQMIVLQLSGANGTKRNTNVTIRNNAMQRTTTSVAVTRGDGTVDGLVVDGTHLWTGPTRITRSADFQDVTDTTYPAVEASDFVEFAEQVTPTLLIDQGETPTNPAATDLAGRPRIVGAGIDIGPYELG